MGEDMAESGHKPDFRLELVDFGSACPLSMQSGSDRDWRIWDLSDSKWPLEASTVGVSWLSPRFLCGSNGTCTTYITKLSHVM